MKKKTVAIPKGMRDFAPAVLARRQYLADAITEVFRRYHFLRLETPAMELLSTLMGKYGQEGDQLLFKVLNSGDYLKGLDGTERDPHAVASRIASKGLRYDLTVPLARYVAMHRSDIAFPFRRFQIQPVWRADRPQRGRYREFLQCDIDVVGTRSLLCEAEIIAIITAVCDALGLQNYRVRVNHRGLLAGMASLAGARDETLFFSTLDKWDKVGGEKVRNEWQKQGLEEKKLDALFALFAVKGSFKEKIDALSARFAASPEAQKGLADMAEILFLLAKMGISTEALELDATLARGLTYYTGSLFEVTLDKTAIGSVGGGGRYDHLADTFGLPGVSGVGFSFGIDRLYDALDTLDLFPPHIGGSSSATLIAHLDKESMHYGLEVVEKIRKKGLCAEVYPETVKLKKQLAYAHKKAIPFVVVIGEQERESGRLTLKDMRKGTQRQLTVDELMYALHV